MVKPARNAKTKKSIVPLLLLVVMAVALGCSLMHTHSLKLLMDGDASFKSNVGADSSITIHDRFALAKKESKGFFTDIDDADWRRLKERFQSTQPNMLFDPNSEEYKKKNERNKANIFWTENYDPEFTCQHERKIGPLGDGGKWVCDPHRIDKDNCIVYSVGSCGDFSFEEAVFKDISKSCEIHTFDIIKEKGNMDFAKLGKEAGVEFHHYGLGKPSETDTNLKPLRKIISELKHEGKTIDILKIDCEGCEWGQYEDWIKDLTTAGVTVRMFLIEVHNAPYLKTLQFFKMMLDAGYVIYHKEYNGYWHKYIEMAFVLLDTDFQKA